MNLLLYKFSTDSSFSQGFRFIFENVMTMTFSLHENLDFGSFNNPHEGEFSSINRSKSNEFYLFIEKMQTPNINNYIQRPRLDEILLKSVEKFGATLISGRSGTGKTALAVNFACNYRKVAWLRLDSADAEWNTFSNYFSNSVEYPLVGVKKNMPKVASKFSNPTEVSQFIESELSKIKYSDQIEPLLMVLDDIHHIFDADWFEEFFMRLVSSLSPDIHLLMLSRGTPALPLWRLRSKQLLGVIDERLLSFNLKETTELFEKSGRSSETASQAFIKSFGRISRLKGFVEAV